MKPVRNSTSSMYDAGEWSASGSGRVAAASVRPTAMRAATPRLPATAISRVAVTPNARTSTKPVSRAPANAPKVLR